MTTWTSPAITEVKHYLLREESGFLLREQGDRILVEDSKNHWNGDTKHSSSFTSPNKATTSWSSPTKN